MNTEHILGMCKARINQVGDYCNKPTVRGGQYCSEHTCIVEGCKEHVVDIIPFCYCSKHHPWRMDWADITKAVTGKHWQHLTDREERELIEVVSLSDSLAEAKDLWKRLTEEAKEAEKVQS